MKYLLFGCIVASFILAASCAKQTTPTGGPKDTIPPTLVSSIPVNKQTNFNDNTITLSFDEYVVVNNPREQIIITPSVGKDVEVMARKKSVIINIEAPLEDSTTYTINFRDAVQDITEKNPAENLKLAFSTGAYIDSLSITGTVVDLLKQKTIEKITVALYHNADTFDIFSHSPVYFTQTNGEGEFDIENLKEGTYYIYAFEDKNKNLVVDSKTEFYGFKTFPVQLQPHSKPDINIGLIRLDARKLRLISARPSNTYFAIKLTKGLQTFDLQTTNNQDSVVFTYSKEQNAINVYPVTMSQDSIPVQFQARDSIDSTIDTLLYVKLLDRKLQPEKFSTTAEPPSLFLNTGEFTTTLKFTKPVSYINFDSIAFRIDSTHVVHFQPEDIQITKPNQLTITKKIDKSLYQEQKVEQTEKPSQTLTASDLKKGASTSQSAGKLNQFVLGKAAFISIEKDSSQHSEQKVNVYKPEDTSTISVSVQTSEDNYIVQLLNGKFEIIRSAVNQENIVFSNLLPGDYQIRLVVDENANTNWDAGNFFKKQEPEKVTYYRSEEGLQSVNIKANWELGPLLIKYEDDVEISP